MGISAKCGRMLYLTAREYQLVNDVTNLTSQKRRLMFRTEDVTRTVNAIKNTRHMVFEKANGESELSYGALMGEGAYNQGETDRYFITDGKNIILDASTANAAKGAGIDPGAKVNFSSDNFNKFMDKLGKTKTSEDSWYNIAIGNLSKTLTDEDKAKLNTFKIEYGSYPTASDSTISINGLLDKMGSLKYGDQNYSAKNIYNGQNDYYGGISNHVELYQQGDHGGWGDQTEVITNADKYLNSYKEAVLKATGQPSGSQLDKLLSEYVKEIREGLSTYSSDGGKTSRLGSTGSSSSSPNDGGPQTADAGKTQEIFTHWASSTRGSSDNDHVGIRVQTLLKRMLEIAIQYMSSGSNGKTSNFSNNSTEFKKCINEKGYNVADYEAKLKEKIGTNKFYSAVCYLKSDTTGAINEIDTAKFYYDLFRQICEKGYKIGEDLDDKSKFQAKLENGTYQIISNTKDNYGTPTNITNAELGIYVQVIGGEEYDKKAEAYKDREMAKIHREESEVDDELTVRNSELTAVRNWKNNEQQTLTANIQSSFQLFVQA